MSAERAEITKEMACQAALVSECLENAGIGVTSARWAYDRELCHWRLLLEVPELNRMGPRKVYELLLEAISEDETLRGLELKDVSVWAISSLPCCEQLTRG